MFKVSRMATIVRLKQTLPRSVPKARSGESTSAAELIDWAESQGLLSEDLDGEIHDRASAAASDLNNGGLPAQIGFLVGQFGVAETRKLLTQIVADKAP